MVLRFIYNKLFQRIFIDERTGENFYEKLRKEIKDIPEEEKWRKELQCVLGFINSNGPSFVTSLRYRNSSKESLKTRLMISGEENCFYKKESVHDNHDIVFCQICKNLFFSKTCEKSSRKIVEEHVATREHQEAIFFETYLAEVPKEIIPDLPSMMKMKDNFDFVVNIADGVAYGPVMGLEHCYSFGKS